MSQCLIASCGQVVDGNTGDGRSGQTSDAGPHESQPGVEEQRARRDSGGEAAGRVGVSEPSANGYFASAPGQVGKLSLVVLFRTGV